MLYLNFPMTMHKPCHGSPHINTRVPSYTSRVPMSTTCLHSTNSGSYEHHIALKYVHSHTWSKTKIKKWSCKSLVKAPHLLTHGFPLTVQRFLWPQHDFTHPVQVHILQLRPLKHILLYQVQIPKNQHAKKWTCKPFHGSPFIYKWISTYSTEVPMTTHNMPFTHLRCFHTHDELTNAESQ